MDLQSADRQGIAAGLPVYRRLENAHILLWLIKDICWAVVWRPGGMMMILPAAGMSLYLLWRGRRIRAELFHNMAVCFWIIANSLWMTGEFYDLDTIVRPYVTGLFACGLAILCVYYALFFAADRKRAGKRQLPADAGVPEERINPPFSTTY